MRRDARHWKLSEESMALFLEQANLRLLTFSYAELGKKTGMTGNSARVTMWNLMHEIKKGAPRVHRGTAEKKLEGVIAELRKWKVAV